MTFESYILRKQYFPKSIKDIPWFIEHSPELRLWNIEGYVNKKHIILSMLMMAHSEPECFDFHDWLVENRHILELDICLNRFNVLLNPNGRHQYRNIYHCMAKTMDVSLVKQFIEHGKILHEST